MPITELLSLAAQIESRALANLDYARRFKFGRYQPDFVLIPHPGEAPMRHRIAYRDFAAGGAGVLVGVAISVAVMLSLVRT